MFRMNSELWTPRLLHWTFVCRGLHMCLSKNNLLTAAGRLDGARYILSHTRRTQHTLATGEHFSKNAHCEVWCAFNGLESESPCIFSNPRLNGDAYRSSQGYDAIVRILSESGVDNAAKDDTAQTPLHLATAQGHTKTILALIEAGAEVDARDDQGKTPLFAAVSNGDDAVVRLLHQKGADPNVRVLSAGSGIDLSMVEDAVLESFSAEHQKHG